MPAFGAFVFVCWQVTTILPNAYYVHKKIAAHDRIMEPDRQFGGPEVFCGYADGDEELVSLADARRRLQRIVGER